jgi:Asp-tRNA(Asn)/Glu-tRNA(Gln) amidotransferase A subunit family amidase
MSPKSVVDVVKKGVSTVSQTDDVMEEQPTSSSVEDVLPTLPEEPVEEKPKGKGKKGAKKVVKEEAGEVEEPKPRRKSSKKVVKEEVSEAEQDGDVSAVEEEPKKKPASKKKATKKVVKEEEVSEAEEPKPKRKSPKKVVKEEVVESEQDGDVSAVEEEPKKKTASRKKAPKKDVVKDEVSEDDVLVVPVSSEVPVETNNDVVSGEKVNEKLSVLYTMFQNLTNDIRQDNSDIKATQKVLENKLSELYEFVDKSFKLMTTTKST